MLTTIAIVVGILWLLGVIVVDISTPLLHLLLVVAVVIFIYDMVARRGRS